MNDPTYKNAGIPPVIPSSFQTSSWKCSTTCVRLDWQRTRKVGNRTNNNWNSGSPIFDLLIANWRKRLFYLLTRDYHQHFQAVNFFLLNRQDRTLKLYHLGYVHQQSSNRGDEKPIEKKSLFWMKYQTVLRKRTPFTKGGLVLF